MASMMYKTERRINIQFTLNDISEETCNKIVEFIQKVVDEENRATPSINVLDELIIARKEEEEKKTVSHDIPLSYNLVKVEKSGRKKKDERIDEILDLYMDYKSQPKNYDLVKMTTHEFIENNPVYEGCSPIAVGKKLTKIAHDYADIIPEPEVTIGKTPGGSPSKLMVYRVPVRKTTYGSLIKKCREQNGLSVRDFSDLTGYDIGLVKSWEDDMKTPSNEAIANIEQICGGHVFDAMRAQ
jgi:hypothetical protein